MSLSIVIDQHNSRGGAGTHLVITDSIRDDHNNGHAQFFTRGRYSTEPFFDCQIASLGGFNAIFGHSWFKTEDGKVDEEKIINLLYSLCQFGGKRSIAFNYNV